jgi:hypothetical protein
MKGGASNVAVGVASLGADSVNELGEALAAPPASTSSGSTASLPPVPQPTASSAAAAAAAAAAGRNSAMPNRPGAATPHTALAFSKVAVGGTFDHVHAGHRLLLAATALVATQEVFIGVTGEAQTMGVCTRGRPVGCRSWAAHDATHAARCTQQLHQHGPGHTLSSCNH